MENKEWFLYVVDHHEGPFTAGEIKKIVKKGEAKTSSYVWKDGMEDWVMMSDVTDFGPGSAKSDGHGPFAFLTKIFKKKGAQPQPVATGAAAGAAAMDPSAANTGSFDPAALSDSVSSGPHVSDVSPSDSVWCLNSNKEFSGPFSMKNIVRKINDGDAMVEDGVWKEGWKSFVRISNIPAFMEGVKPDVLAGKADKKKKKKNKKAAADSMSSAAALGMGGKSSVRTYRWYKSRKFSALVTISLLVAVYNALTFGQLDPVLEKIPGAKEKVAALKLPRIPWRPIMQQVYQVKDMAMPFYYKGVAMLPDPVQSFLSAVQLPEGLAPNDVENLREVAASDIKTGVHVASALPVGDELNPSFLIASNAPDGTSFTVVLRGKEGRLLNSFNFEKTLTVDITKHIAATPRFMAEGNKPLPKGEYFLLVYESDMQNNAEAAKALAATPKKPMNNLIGKEKVAFVVDSFFLGGTKDPNFEKRLAEYAAKIKDQLANEGMELKQLALTLEQMANESYTKFGTLAVAAATPQRKNLWNQYHTTYSKQAGQIKAMVTKVTPQTRANFVLASLYEKAGKTYELTESLHQAETDFIEKGGNRAAVDQQGTAAANAINDLKQAIFKVIK